MKRIVVGIAIAVGLFVCAGFIGPAAIAQQPLINPGPGLPPAADNTPAIGIAHLPVRPDNGRGPASQLAISAASTSSLIDIVRCPAADPSNPDCNNIFSWVPLESATAYYHDPIIAAVTTIYGATDGETWNVNFTRPSGSQINIGPVTFSSAGNCFNLVSYTVCGSTDIVIYWYFRSQCAETGTWHVDARDNGNSIGALDFYVKPQIGTPAEIAGKLPSYAQMSYSQNYANTCHDPGAGNFYFCSLNKPGQVPWTIAEQGCTVTSFASMLTYFGVPVDPPTLNQWFIDNGQYNSDGSIKLDAVSAYAKSLNAEVTHINIGSGDATGLSNNICTYGPVPIRVNNDKHTVTAIGRDDALTTVSFLDSGDGVTKDLTSTNPPNQFNAQYLFAGPEHHFADRSGLTFTFHSPVEAFVVDPFGRRQGIDPRSGSVYNEIPRAFYGGITQIGPMVPSGYEPPKVLDVIQPAEGLYTLTVVGTGSGTYNAEFEAHDIALNGTEISVKDMPTSPGVVDTYQINFAKAVGSRIQVAGGFDGGGQRPRDVNRFLTYASPGQSTTSLPTGTTSYSLFLFYGATIIPSSFSAQLNGMDVTALFHPAAGSAEKVSFDLQLGRNVLVLSVDGNLPNRMATDTDRLIFDVQ